MAGVFGDFGDELTGMFQSHSHPREQQHVERKQPSACPQGTLQRQGWGPLPVMVMLRLLMTAQPDSVLERGKKDA